MNLRPAVAGAALVALATGCAANLAPGVTAVPSTFAQAVSLGTKKPSPIVVKPAKVTFATSPKTKFTIFEASYRGTFTVSMPSNSKIVKLLKTRGKGPGPVAIPLEAIAAGTATLTVSDANKQRVSVPVTVTTAVVTVH